VLTGVRAAAFVPLENTSSSLLKLALMISLVRLLPSAGSTRHRHRLSRMPLYR
jgi:hypothetical protein